MEMFLPLFHAVYKFRSLFVLQVLEYVLQEQKPK